MNHKRYYLNAFHEKHSKKCEEEVKRVAKLKFTLKEMIDQSKELNKDRLIDLKYKL